MDRRPKGIFEARSYLLSDIFDREYDDSSWVFTESETDVIQRLIVWLKQEHKDMPIQLFLDVIHAQDKTLEAALREVLVWDPIFIHFVYFRLQQGNMVCFHCKEEGDSRMRGRGRVCSFRTALQQLKNVEYSYCNYCYRNLYHFIRWVDHRDY